ncbi:probable chitinase 10 isoform X1 [Bemisia tabaci]|uniref:probable chitinase 10 isoform X1 n=1 Tax=Bemisia tabaci TaxID=7038 RepID=UPI003B281AAA
MLKNLPQIALFLGACAVTYVSSDAQPAAAAQPFHVMCYYDERAGIDRGNDQGKVTPKNLLSGAQAEYCTHLIYGFAIVGNDSKSIQVRSAKSEELYKDLTALKAKGINTLIALGGAEDSKNFEKYVKLVTNVDNRKAFVESVVAFLSKHKFDGLLLQWEYPVCRDGSDCTKGSVDERTGYGELMKQLSEALKPKSFLLAAGISPKIDVIDKAYNVQVLTKYLDFVLVEGYKYNQGYSKVFETQFYNVNTTTEPSVVNTIMQLHTKGVPLKKQVLGISLAGNSYVLAAADKHGYGVAATGPGAAAEFTKLPGVMGYFEICNNVVNKGWKVVHERKNTVKLNPYAFKGNQLVTYEDTTDLLRKGKFIKDQKMLGAAVWSADLDDIRNICKCGNFPMLRALNQELRGETVVPGKKMWENCA